MEPKIEITATEKELILREGDASSAIDTRPRVKEISGTIETPNLWIRKRKAEIIQDTSHIQVDRDKMTITLFIGDKSQYQDIITGKLDMHPKFVKFGINKGQYRSSFEMAELIKMNRSFFDNHSVAMELVSALKNLKAKVAQNIEKADNNRGDKTQVFQQTVESNVPTTFKLNIPLFKGMPTQSIEVEVYFKPEDMTCTLVSPHANDLIEEQSDLILDGQLEQIEEIYPELTIIEI